MTPCELIAHRSRIRCARNDSDILPDHVVESKKVLAGLDQYTGAVCEHHAGKVHNLHARQRNCSRSALHVGGVVNNRIEPSALVYRHPFYRERHVQLRFKRSCNAFAKFDCVTDWPSLIVYVRERPRICPIGNSKRCSLVNGPQAAVAWLGKGKASGQDEASERRNYRPHHCTSERLSAPLIKGCYRSQSCGTQRCEPVLRIGRSRAHEQHRHSRLPLYRRDLYHLRRSLGEGVGGNHSVDIPPCIRHGLSFLNFLDSVVRTTRRARITWGDEARVRHHEPALVARCCSPAKLLGFPKLVGTPRCNDPRRGHQCDWLSQGGRVAIASLNRRTAPSGKPIHSRDAASVKGPRTWPRCAPPYGRTPDHLSHWHRCQFQRP